MAKRPTPGSAISGYIYIWLQAARTSSSISGSARCLPTLLQ